MKTRTFAGRAHLLASMFMSALGTAAMPVGATARHNSAVAVSVGGNDLGGVVKSAKGPEAGVWVIADPTLIDEIAA